MKKTYLMLLLALAGFGSSCTNDDGTTETPVGAANEIQLVFSGSGESEEYTKAIASNSENEIKNLKVYLFAAATAGAGDDAYEFMETWTMTGAAPGANQFLLQSSGSSYKASIKPGELKGLPYLTLVCVANQDNLFKADGNPFGALTAVTTDATGAIATNGTTLAEFKAAYTGKLAAGDILKTPLAMTGTGTTKISGSVSKVAITLKRIMARFDIDNTTATSRLTIKSVALGQGRPNGSLFGVTPGAITGAPDVSADLMTYADVAFTGENANQGTLESAIYVYPNLDTDQSYLIIKGAYSSTLTNQPVDVTYNIPIVKTPAEANPGDPANYIAINANSRYKLRITDVTESNIYSTFEVEDWTSAGGVIVKPENDAPVFDAANGFTITDGGDPADLPVAIVNGGVTSTTEFKVVDNKSFKATIAATGKVRAEKAPATKTDAAADAWLAIAEPTYEEIDGVWHTTFVFTSTDATGKQPVNVTFINEAASYDPDLWTTLTFYGPLAAPTLADATGHSTGNTVDIVASTATMYKIANSLIKIETMCIEGVTVDVPAGFVAEAGETNGYKTTYTIKISDVSQLVEGEQKIAFQNEEDPNVKTELTVTLTEPGMTMVEGTDTNNAATVSDNTIEVDLDALSSGNFTFKVNAPQGLTAGSLECLWLTITESHAWEDTEGNRYAEYTVSAKGGTPANFDDFEIAFTNTLAGADNLTVTLTKAASKPKLEEATAGTASDFNGTVSFTNANTAIVNMYKAKDSKVYVKMTCDEGAAFDAVSGLTVVEQSDGNYEIKVTDATQFTAGATTVVTAKNNDDNNRTATLTITWQDPAMTVSLATSDAVDESKNGDDIVYTVYCDDLPGKGFTFDVTAPKGATADFSEMTTWASMSGGSTTIGENSAETYTIKASGNVDDTKDITVTITNKIANGGDQKIIFKYATAKAP